jgi:hypothetical protein
MDRAQNNITPHQRRLIAMAAVSLTVLLAAGCAADNLTAPTDPAPSPMLTANAAEVEPSAIPEVGAAAVASAHENAADADVVFVKAVLSEGGSWTFHVTVSHPDTGWEDYADGWDVVADGGKVLKTEADAGFTKLLLHPHENEQPFTRSQSGIIVPDGVSIVTVRAHDIVDGFGGREVIVDLSVEKGLDFVVQRG